MKLSVNKHTQKLISFIEKSPTPFHAVSNIVSILKDSGALSFDEADHTAIEPGNTYYVTRGMSSVIAFKMPENPKAFMICASHTDSPCFKLKPDFHKKGAGGLIMLDTEKYGGMINSSWLDRPLSVAGRVAIRSSAGITLRNVNIDRDLLVIPNVCIHFNRSINDGFKYNPQTDLSPVYAEGTDSSSLIKLIANELEIDESAIISHDLYVYNRTKGTFWGADNEFFSAPRIDNLQCTYSTLMGFLASSQNQNIQIYASFDNEETGSSSRQGAASTFLFDTVTRIREAMGISHTEYVRMLASSMMVSADNAHALHPSHPEFYDPLNAPLMNAGVVIKSNASQRYTTDAVSSALFTEICKSAKVPYQFFANRSDVAGGSTLGNISNNKVALPTVDIGLAQLAMHSAYESAGSGDTQYMINCIKQFYNTVIVCDKDGFYSVK